MGWHRSTLYSVAKTQGRKRELKRTAQALQSQDAPEEDWTTARHGRKDLGPQPLAGRGSRIQFKGRLGYIQILSKKQNIKKQTNQPTIAGVVEYYRVPALHAQGPGFEPQY